MREIIDYCKDIVSELPVNHELHFINYVSSVNTGLEGYLVARNLLEEIKSFCNNSNNELDKIIYRKMMNEVFKKDVVPLKKGFNMKLPDLEYTYVSGVSEDTLRLLSGEYDSYIYYGIKHADVRSRYVQELDKATDLDLRMKLDQCKAEDRSMTDYFTMFDMTDEFDAKFININALMTDSTENIEYYLKLTDSDQKTFQWQQKREYDRVCKLQTNQILDYITESEDNLISHLLFHNQILRIATHGDNEYIQRINRLIDKLEKWKDNKYIESEIGENYIDISIKKEWTHKIQVRNDSKVIDVKGKAGRSFERKKKIDKYFYRKKGKESKYKIDGEFGKAEMTFVGREGEGFFRPPYKEIRYNPNLFTDAKLGTHLEDMRKKISRLSLGASTGSINVLWTMNKHREVFENLSPEFRKKIVDVDFTCNERFWHNSNYDMCLLGDAENRWKPHVQNDSDLLLNHRQVLSYTAQKSKDLMLFVDGFFGAQASLGIRKIFPDEFSDKKIVQNLKDNRDLVVVTLNNSKMTDSGMELKILNISDEVDVKIAESKNAIVIPYDVYSQMNVVINDYTNPYVLKFYNKFLTVMKALQLFNPGTWMRNIVDATMKAISDTGETFNLSRNYVRAMRMRNDYLKIQGIIEEQRGFTHSSNIDVERVWDDVVRAANCDLTYKEYEMLDSWFNKGISGGASKETTEILRAAEQSQTVSKMFREDNGYDIIADDMVKFEQLDPSRVEKVYNKIFRVNEVPEMTLDEYMKIFRKEINPSDSKYIIYKDLSERIMRYLGQEDMSLGYKLDNGLTRLITGALKPMSYSEEIMRLGQYLTLSDQGYTSMEIFRHIKEPQFDYDFKSWRNKYASLVLLTYWKTIFKKTPLKTSSSTRAIEKT